VYNEMQCKLM